MDVPHCSYTNEQPMSSAVIVNQFSGLCGNVKDIRAIATITWIEMNYEWADGVCLPRCMLYQHYLEFCQENEYSPVGPATFGKLIRQKFPKATTRRLGTRGQSIYHYCGIGIQKTSVYHKHVYKGRQLSRFSGIKIKTEGGARKYSFGPKTGILFPKFPEPENLISCDGMNVEKVSTFLVMYRTHCQRILDTVIAANFGEVQKFVIHFWQGIPSHLLPILDSKVLADFILCCDTSLYRVLNDVLVPSSIQEIPDSLCCEIENFVRNFPTWIGQATVPSNLQLIKLQSAHVFSRFILRQLTFLRLAQTVRVLLGNQEMTRRMHRELVELNVDSICIQFSSLIPSHATSCRQLITNYYPRFLYHLEHQGSLEDLMVWLDDVVDACVVQQSSHGSKNNSLRWDFMLHWSYLTFLFIRDLTLKSSFSFGSFHLLQLMFDEYIQLVLEGLTVKESEETLQLSLCRYFQESGIININ